MQLFYAPDITPPLYTLPEEESGHCVRVLRLGVGDSLYITDGRGTLYRAVVEDAHPKRCTIRIVEEHAEWEKRPYRLTVAVAPTKNIDRIEWFVEKATECGIDRIVPILCDHSERKVIKGERLEKIAVSAMKQSLKAYLPKIEPLTPFAKLLAEPFDGVRLIAHCEEDMERIFMGEKLRGEADYRFIAVEPASCPSLTRGKYVFDYCDTGMVCPLSKMYTLGSNYIPAASHAGGLRYHGMSSTLSQLYADGLMEARSVAQTDVFAAAQEFAKCEGILPAPESSHAIKAAIDEALRCKENKITALQIVTA